MDTLEFFFESFEQKKVLIIGDVMLDSYIWGNVSRISPEAPVPIVNTQKREKRLGGAANVALNIKALGAYPIVCAVVGDDAEGNELRALFENEGVGAEGLVIDKDRPTTIKHRIMAGSQQLLRVDSESTASVSEEVTSRLKEKVAELVDEVDVVVFEDYDKGVLTDGLIRYTIEIAKKKNTPTLVDPKQRNFLAYTGATLFKPNLKELKEGLKLDYALDGLDPIKEAVTALHNEMLVDNALITLSENGVYITNFDDDYHMPAHKREISDVSGAGDTVISIAALCMAADMPLHLVAGLANLGGGLVCETLGVVPIDKHRLLEEAIKHYGGYFSR